MRKPRAKAQKTQIALAIGKVIRARRMDSGLTQERFAELTGLSKNYVGNLERGEYEISLSCLSKVARSLNMTASKLLAEAGF